MEEDDDLLREIMAQQDQSVGKLPGAHLDDFLSEMSAQRPKKKRATPEVSGGRRRTRNEKDKFRKHLEEAGIKETQLREILSTPKNNRGHGTQPISVVRSSSSASQSSSTKGRPIKIVIRRKSKGKHKHYTVLRVEGLSQSEVSKFTTERKKIGGKKPFMIAEKKGIGMDGSDPSMIPFINEAQNFDSHLFSLQSHAAHLKLITGRKPLDSLSLGELCKVLEDLQDVFRDAQRRGLAIKDKLEKLKPDIASDDNYRKSFNSSSQLLHMLDIGEIEKTVIRAKEAAELQKNSPDLSVVRPKGQDAEPPPAKPESAKRDPPPKPKNKDKKARSRPPPSHRGLWDSWDTYWKFPSMNEVNNALKIKPLPPFTEKNRDSAFDLPEIDRRDDIRKPQSADSLSNNHHLSKRLLCCLLFGSEMDIDKVSKREKRPEMGPAIRAVLTGISYSDWDHPIPEEVTMPPIRELSAYGNDEKNGASSASQIEGRLCEELGAIDSLDMPPDDKLLRCVSERKDHELYQSLRDRQVRLYRQTEENNKLRMKFIKLVSSAGIPLDVEKTKLVRLKEAYSELHRVYRMYRKKGIQATQFQVTKALSQLEHLRKECGPRGENTGVFVDPRTLDGIPRYEMKRFEDRYIEQKQKFAESRRPLKLDGAVMQSLKGGSESRQHKVVTVLSHVNPTRRAEYMSSDQIFFNGAEDLNGDDDDYGEMNGDNDMMDIDEYDNFL